MNEQEQKAYAEEKAKELINIRWVNDDKLKDFILSIIKDFQPKVNKEWIQHLIYVCDDIEDGELPVEFLYEMLKEKGLEVEKEKPIREKKWKDIYEKPDNKQRVMTQKRRSK